MIWSSVWYKLKPKSIFSQSKRIRLWTVLIESVGLIDKMMVKSQRNQHHKSLYLQKTKDCKANVNAHRMVKLTWSSLFEDAARNLNCWHHNNVSLSIWQCHILDARKWEISPWVWVGCFTTERFNGLGGEGDCVGVFARELHLKVELRIRLLFDRVHCRHPSGHYLAKLVTAAPLWAEPVLGLSCGLPGRRPVPD